MHRRTFHQTVGMATLAWSISAHKPATGDQDDAVRSLTIKTDEDQLEDLHQRLSRTRFPEPIEVGGWDYGTDLDYLRTLVDYWRMDYDWSTAERSLNALHHFVTPIDGLDVHFIHQRSPHTGALPLVITHGWPGSVFEFYKILGPLTDPPAHGGQAEDAFHVICPSMPGYGYSAKPRVRGFGRDQVAQTIARLMPRLGYERYGAQGGDIGAQVAVWLGAHDASHVVGVHLNWMPVGPPDEATRWEGVSPAEKERFEARGRDLARHYAYAAIQGTRPQTLGMALNDSPAGLAAWIIDKFRAWSDCGGDVEKSFTRDELLTNIMLYWLTGSIASSFGLYYTSGSWPAPKVPLGVALFPKEISVPPRKWVEARYTLSHWTQMPRGGHFAALEEPQLLVEDIRKFFRPLR